jgi:MFS transporter, FSR family, fosmidomycin resistance protein
MSSQAHPLTAASRAAAPRAFATGKVVLVSLGHLTHDTYPAFLATLIPLLKEKLALSNALAGSLATFLRSSSLVQPFIGYLADRTSARWFVILAPAASALFMSLLGAAPSYLLMVPLLVLTGLSHACYHAPAPAMIAYVSGDYVGRGMSLFMMGGELGRALGPLIIVAAVQWFGLEGSYVAALPGILASVMMARFLGPVPRPEKREDGFGIRALLVERRRPLAILLGFVAMRSVVIGTVSVFTPAYLVARGMTLTQAAVGYALFELAGAAGALAGGTVSDRMGRRLTLIVIQAMVVPFFYAMTAGPAALLIPFLALTGVLVFSGTPVILAMVQEMLPEARSTASGLYFSLNYILTGSAAVVFGLLADSLGIERAFILLSFAPLLTLPLALFLPDRLRTRRSQ